LAESNQFTCALFQYASAVESAWGVLPLNVRHFGLETVYLIRKLLMICISIYQLKGIVPIALIMSLEIGTKKKGLSPSAISVIVVIIIKYYLIRS
jgi:hypothetical protein